VGAGNSGPLTLINNIIRYEGSTFYLNYRSLKHSDIRQIASMEV